MNQHLRKNERKQGPLHIRPALITATMANTWVYDNGMYIAGGGVFG